MLNSLKTIFDIIILAGAWLDLKNLDYTQFNIQNYIMFKTANDINQNDGIIVFIIKLIS